ncbi:endonuclease [Pantoea phage vB_PagS_Vid5]|uniref:Endonuclease n=1 Tax=Pantoea phage vB_PagS_Vid5 TaxID=2099652 RepID=A0A2P1CKS7_9CAUD|nr:RusA-like Holliday junction resolvase [Pantoea phage vB_PagS_Vid5]AVJ51809.1 endonuclease [Pantoea phage vB_PagS_Vid5]
MASINVRTKGQTGERDVCDMLNKVYAAVYEHLGLTFPAKPIAQRNQNQSAVGGCDITNTCHFAIEVKRQEALSINTWWRQCEVSACEVKKFPVLIYRQNKQKWKVLCYVHPLRLLSSEPVRPVRAEMSIEDFLLYFKDHATEYIKMNGSAA